MDVNHISFKNFRNLSEQNVELDPGINIFYGKNGQGKTNFLESLYFCATGRSHRTHIDKELINFNENDAFLQLYYTEGTIKDKISAHIKREFKKGMTFNNIPIKKIGELLGKLMVVVFSPEDLQLIKSGPSERRKYMDTEICQMSGIYYNELGSYYRVLKHRNNLLKSANGNRKTQLDTIDIWDEQLSRHGGKIYEFRKNFIDGINAIASEIYGYISGKNEFLSLSYKPNATASNFLERLKKNAERDILLGSTSSGVHKDDILVSVNGFDLKSFGSQGQQRTASLSLKLAEIEYIKNKRNTMPVLLLDDVLSELDERRQKYLLAYIRDIQAVITCTGAEDVIKNMNVGNKANVFLVENGGIFKA